MPDNKTMEWNAEDEIKLLLSHKGLKPVGINKHFYMAFIASQFSKIVNRDVSSEAIWAYMDSLYKLDILDKEEPIPFPNEEKEFSLPESEFSTFLAKKLSESDNESSSEASGIFEKGGSKVLNSLKELDRKELSKTSDQPKRSQKRTRGSLSLETVSPSTTPPPQNNKRRRI